LVAPRSKNSCAAKRFKPNGVGGAHGCRDPLDYALAFVEAVSRLRGIYENNEAAWLVQEPSRPRPMFNLADHPAAAGR
jgi:hypothetical protein